MTTAPMSPQSGLGPLVVQGAEFLKALEGAAASAAPGTRMQLAALAKDAEKILVSLAGLMAAR